jgi:hypothetical protein
MRQLRAAASDKIDTLEVCCPQGGPSSRLVDSQSLSTGIQIAAYHIQAFSFDLH